MIGKIFKRGLIAVAPIAVTLALLHWLFTTFEGVFSGPIKAIIGEQHYYRGMGIGFALVIIFFIGFVINSWLVQKLSSWGDALVSKIPLVKTLYNSVGEMMSYFGSKETQKQGSVVLVEIHGFKFVGLVTRESFDELPRGIAEDGDIAVYLPLGYMIGGHTVILPRSKVKRIDMTVEEGMRFCVSAGVLAHAKKNGDEASASDKK
jgi:uncharacterized membrane protein